MTESGECEGLLGGDVSGRGDGSSTGEDSCSRSEEWWDGTGSATGSSCDSSYCSESDSYGGSEGEWEAEVNQNGELFYIKSSPVLPADQPVVAPKPVPEVENLTRRNRHSTRGKLVHLIRRRNSKRQPPRSAEGPPRVPPATPGQPEGVTGRAAGSNKVTFHDWQEGEVREVTMSVDPRGRHNLGRRATLCETLLGLVVSTFADGTRIMVAGFIPNGEAIRYKSIKIGDWLRCIDEQDVTFQTIDAFLANITAPCKVHLKLQRVAGCEVTEPLQTPGSLAAGGRQSELVRRLLGQAGDAPPPGDEPVGVLYVSLDEGGPSAQEEQGVAYCYPPPVAGSLLARSRGCFLTLQLLLPDAVRSAPVSSTVLLRDQLYHVVYTARGRELMLFAVPDDRCPLREAVDLCADVVRFLEFRYQSLSRAFQSRERHGELDAYFCRLFSHVLGARESRSGARWEELLPAAHWLPLPKEAQIQLDECLSELESNDFGEMADGLDDYQRMYIVIGTCMYHKGYLLGSHLARTDLADVHALCRQLGLLRLARHEPVSSLVLWHEVFPSSCGRGLVGPPARLPLAPYQPPSGRWFLLLVGQGQDLLAVLLESGGCTARAGERPGPDALYVEQAQDVLAYLIEVGVSAVADKWLAANPRPSVVSPELVAAGRSSQRLGPAEAPGSAKLSPVAGGAGSPVGRKSPKVTSILKRRGSLDHSFACSGSGLSLHGSTSEDSASQTASVLSDEAAPILGRRAERGRAPASGSQSSGDSDSDWEAYQNENRDKDSTFDISDVRKSLLSQVDDILPTKLTAGKQNALFHYVRLDLTEGVLLCPPSPGHAPAPALAEVLHNFRRSCQAIHALLQNTVHFKKLLAQDIAQSRINKSLVAVKEHGVLFECARGDAEGAGKRQPLPLAYWVVGRLFFTPYPREVYVCYHDAAPQNMVEIAFRLALCTAG
ncbi:protein inturned [Bacillus rossius redtenbacheri]|uniref:protein inturned n=1 Tax=Bacillus rossius redtenbacheri TaxID=93214 RepID=UPI002FDE1BD4